MNRLIRETIPRDPSVSEFRQGNTFGPNNRHWFKAKFHQRYRLFYRFSSQDKVIIYVWMNDAETLRKSGASSDPYRVFRAMLEAGDPPRSIDQSEEANQAPTDQKGTLGGACKAGWLYRKS